MARAKNEKDILLRKRARRRLVGSVVLVIIAIIVLPMILERAPRQERKEIEIIIPSETLPDESLAVVTQKDSIPDTINPVKGSGAESNTSKEVITKAEQVKEKESDLLIKPVQRKKKQDDRVVESKGDSKDSHKNKKPIVAIGKFVVQLGAFSDSTKAKNQQRSLTSNGITKAYTESIKNENTKVTRVRVGPFSTREAAEEEQKKLKKLGINGVVMSK